MKKFGLHILILLFVFSNMGDAQAQPDKYPSNIKIDFKLPLAIGNPAYRKMMNGIADLSLSYQGAAFGNFVYGGGFKYSYFKVNDLKTPELTDGKWYNYNGFAQVGYQKYFTDRIFFDATLRGGYSMISLSSNICETNYERGRVWQQTVTLEPHTSFFMISEDNLAFGLTLGYLDH